MVLCPTCKKKLPVAADQRPFGAFCSSRCRLIDLGAWLDGAHRISSPISEEDLDQGPASSDDDPTSGPH